MSIDQHIDRTVPQMFHFRKQLLELIDSHIQVHPDITQEEKERNTTMALAMSMTMLIQAAKLSKISVSNTTPREEAKAFAGLAHLASLSV